MKSFFLYLTFFAISLYIVSCGDDNTTNNNNNGGGGNNDTLYYKDTFRLECSSMCSTSRDLYFTYNDSNLLSIDNAKIKFEVVHSVLPPTRDANIIVSNQYFIDSVTIDSSGNGLGGVKTFDLPVNNSNYWINIKINLINQTSFNTYVLLKDIILTKTN